MTKVSGGYTICFLSWRDTDHPEGGGSEGYVENLSRSLVERGHRVTVFCSRWPGSARTQDVGGVSIIRGGRRLSVYPRGLAFLLSATGRKFDVVIDVVNGLPFAAGLVRRHGVLALVHHVHREQWRIIYPNWRGKLGWLVESRFTPWLYRRRTFVTVSDSTKRDLIALGVAAQRIEIVRNGNSIDPSTAPRSAAPRLCVLARLVPHKQIEDAIAVVAALAVDLPALTLSIIGAGWWEDKLRAVATELGVMERVVFHGHVPVQERNDLLAASWVMLLPSLKEGWGNAIIEAAAHGVPTIAYRHAGGVCESIVAGETGELVDDLEEMIAVAKKLLTDAQTRERLSRAARTRAATFDWKEAAREFEVVIEDAMARQKA